MGNKVLKQRRSTPKCVGNVSFSDKKSPGKKVKPGVLGSRDIQVSHPVVWKGITAAEFVITGLRCRLLKEEIFESTVIPAIADFADGRQLAKLWEKKLAANFHGQPYVFRG